MTITTNPARDEYTATSGQTEFDYTFKIYAEGDLTVYVTPVGQDADDTNDITTAYTVDPATVGDEDGGFITFNSGLTAGDRVTIVSGIAYDRNTNYSNNGDFVPDTVNADNDRQVSQIKQVLSMSRQGLSFPQSMQGVDDLELPSGDRAESYLGFNATGEPEFKPFVELTDQVAAAEAAQAAAEAARDASEGYSVASASSATQAQSYNTQAEAWASVSQAYAGDATDAKNAAQAAEANTIAVSDSAIVAIEAQETTSINAVSAQETTSVNAVSAQETTSVAAVNSVGDTRAAELAAYDSSASTSASEAEASATASGVYASQAAASAALAKDIANLADVDDYLDQNVGTMDYKSFMARRELVKQQNDGSGVINVGDVPSGYTPIVGAIKNALLAKTSLVAADANMFYANEQRINVAGMEIYVPSLSEFKMPPAPNGTVTYDSADGNITDFTTDVDPKYGDVAADVSEAVSRAFEGDVKNGDYRNNGANWTQGGTGTGTVTYSGGVATYNSTGVGQLSFDSDVFAVEIGVEYIAEIYAHEIDSTGSGLFLRTSVGGSISGADVRFNSGTGKYQLRFTPTTETSVLLRVASGNSIADNLAWSNVSIRPATNEVVTDRVDYAGLETWLEQISTNGGFVFPYGDVQSNITSKWGITFATGNIAQGYSAYGEWDTVTQGTSVSLASLTPAQLSDFISDPKNNMYWHPQDGWIQVRHRRRTFAGAGNGDWLNTNAMSSLRFDLNTYVNVKGIRVNPQPTFSSSSADGYRGNLSAQHLATDSGLYGLPSNSTKIARSYNGECYMMTVATIPRLNQGAYHPSFNAFGAKLFNASSLGSFNGGVTWYAGNVAGTIDSTKTCFTSIDNSNDSSTAGASIGSGEIQYSGLSGRPDDKYHDGIYNSGLNGIIPRLLPAQKQITSELGANVMQDMIAGEYRGEHYLTKFVPFLEFEILDNTYVAASGYMSCDPSTLRSLPPELGGSTSYTPINNVYRDLGISDGKCSTSTTAASINYPYLHFLVCEDSGEFWYGNGGGSNMLYTSGNAITFYQFDTATTAKDGLSLSTWFNNVKGNLTNGEKVTVYACLPTNISVSGNYNQTDVIGDPAEILQNPDLVNGWLGSWIPVIPDGTSKDFPFSHKSLVSTVSQISTADLGTTYGTYSRPIDTTTNDFTDGVSAVYVFLEQYTANAAMTVEADNSVVVGGALGGVFQSSHNSIAWGNLLSESLGAGINTSADSSNGLTPVMLGLTLQGALDTTGELSSDANQLAESTALREITAGTSGDTGFKALSTVTEEDGLLYQQLHWTQLVSDGTDWGDDSKIGIADQTSTKTDANGTTVLYGTARSALPIGIAK